MNIEKTNILRSSDETLFNTYIKYATEILDVLGHKQLFTETFGTGYDDWSYMDGKECDVYGFHLEMYSGYMHVTYTEFGEYNLFFNYPKNNIKYLNHGDWEENFKLIYEKRFKIKELWIKEEEAKRLEAERREKFLNEVFEPAYEEYCLDEEKYKKMGLEMIHVNMYGEYTILENGKRVYYNYDNIYIPGKWEEMVNELVNIHKEKEEAKRMQYVKARQAEFDNLKNL